MKTVICCMLGASILVGCGRVVLRTPESDNTYRLDECRQQAPEFVDSVKKFYRALQDKDWPTSYDMRTANFKQDMTREVYLKKMADDGKRLISYKILNVRLYGDTNGNFTAGEIIMEFNEAGIDCYGCARWIKREGNWVCDEPGLSGLLQSLRAPDWMPK